MLYNTAHRTRQEVVEMARSFGDYLRECRLERRLTLREFSRIAGIDPGNYSKMERGLLPPPKGREKLEEYAQHLGLERGTDGWLEFFDLAAAEQGRIPDDVLEDRELMDRLPLLFRTSRGQKLDDNELTRLIEYLRRGAGGMD